MNLCLSVKKNDVLGESGSQIGATRATKTVMSPFEEEDVSPRVNRHGSDAPFWDLGQSCCQETTECTGHTSCRDEDSDPEQQLVPRTHPEKLSQRAAPERR